MYKNVVLCSYLLVGAIQSIHREVSYCMNYKEAAGYAVLACNDVLKEKDVSFEGRKRFIQSLCSYMYLYFCTKLNEDVYEEACILESSKNESEYIKRLIEYYQSKSEIDYNDLFSV